MATPDTITEAIEQQALRPKDVMEDGKRITYRSLAELQEARDREAARTAKAKRGFGLRFQVMVPPGAG